MSSFDLNGVVNMTDAIIKTFKLAKRAAITRGDILVNDGVEGGSGQGYLTPWYSAGTKAMVAVALSDCANPSADGADEVQAALVCDNLLVRVDAAGITAAMVGTFCDVNGAQSIDVTAKANCNAFIIEAEVAAAKAVVMLFIRPIIATPIEQGVVS